MNKALNCPFCNSHIWRFDHSVNGIFAVECEGCGATGTFCKSEEEAMTAWNTRASPWRPIETAPKDNKEILLRIKHGDLSEPKKSKIEVAFGLGLKPLYDYRIDEGEWYKVINWMPIPE